MAPGGHVFPERLGRYELLLPIGSGGMATVYLARARGVGGFEREVALKLVHPHLREQNELSRELLEEAKLAARIRHPNVVAVLDAAEEPKGVFLVMDYVEGDTLAGLVRRAGGASALGVPIALRILADALLGLHAAHELTDEQGRPLDVVHRDFSPQNVLVGLDGVARLADFGIAKASGRAKVTKTGLVKGKVGYMAPEQARGAKLDRRCDVWAAGVIAWELFAGRRLYEAEDEMSILLRIVQEEPPRLRDVRPEVPAALDDAIGRALTRDPDRRLASVDELRQLVLGAWKRPAEHAEVAESVARIVGPTLSERRVLVETTKRARMHGGAGFARTDSFEAEAPVTNTKTARAAGGRRRAALVALAVGAVGALAGVVAIASARRAAPPATSAPIASEPAAAVPVVAPEAPSAVASVAPTSEAQGDAILVVEGNAPIAAVRVDGKETAVARPAKRVSLPVDAARRDQELSIVAIAVDGRRAEGRGMPGAKPIGVRFGAAVRSAPAPRGTAKTSSPPSPAKTGLAASPYVNETR